MLLFELNNNVVMKVLKPCGEADMIEIKRVVKQRTSFERCFAVVTKIKRNGVGLINWITIYTKWA